MGSLQCRADSFAAHVLLCRRAVGHADQFGKRTLAEETPRVTRGAASWKDPPEIGLLSVQGDGFLLVHNPQGLASLAPPWPLAQDHDEVPIELKMPGDHLDIVAVERVVLRRQARQVQRMEEEAHPPWRGQAPQWLVAPHVPSWLREQRKLEKAAPGCYRVNPYCFQFLWIAANELPLVDELVPFLVARSGRALDELVHWVASRRPLAWLMDMVKFTSMSTIMSQEWLDRFAKVEDDPELEARTQRILYALLKGRPNIRQELINEGRLDEARAALRTVLAQRRLALTADAEARIDTCEEVATLQRWHRQAVTAGSAAEALK